MSATFDVFAITRKVTDQWLDKKIESNIEAVMTALSAPQDGGKGKAERRLTMGWIVARPDGGWHRLDALPRKTLSNVTRGESIEQVLGTNSLTEPHVVVKLGKAGIRSADFSISFGDQLRVGVAGKGVTLVDLRRVRDLLAWFDAEGKADPVKVRKARRALQDQRLEGRSVDVDPKLAAVADTATDAEILYATNVFKLRGK